MAVVTSEALAALKRLPTGCIDAVLTDPPYDLLTGTGKGFMGRAWDGTGIAFNPELWAEVLRVAKPGAHLLAFGGTRTSHRMVCAIEDAGWDIRDSILWLYGTGMPKSADVSKHLDKAAGAARPVVGRYQCPDGRERDPANRNKRAVYGGYTGADSYELTGPATEPAQTWAGWGSALKPSHEPICMARAPFKGTLAANVVANVVANGTGALHIDACRIDGPGWTKHNGEGAHTQQYEDRESTKGRWPANTILSHTDACELLGTKRVKGSNVPGKGALEGTAPGHKMPGIYEGGFKRVPLLPHTDADGRETVESWQCDPACPVAELDRQSGDRPSGAWNGKRTSAKTQGIYHPFTEIRAEAPREASTGGASRFFYVAKPSRAERNHGLDDLPDVPMRVGHERLAIDPRYDRPPNHIPRKNTHQTVKPVTLLRYLARLICPPGGLILDLFCGSGTTGLACIHEGFAFLGIEQEAEYVDIARRRIAACPVPLAYAPRLSDQEIIALFSDIPEGPIDTGVPPCYAGAEATAGRP